MAATIKWEPVLLMFLYVFPTCCLAQGKVNSEKMEFPSPVNNIIPKPVLVTLLNAGATIISGTSFITADRLFRNQALYLRKQMEDQCGLHLTVRRRLLKNRTGIMLRFNQTTVNNPEMYLLSITNNRVVIEARDIEGVVHGIQTLLQLLPLTDTGLISLPSLTISDYPRFRYRGMHLDVSRHFFPVSFIKQYIDYLTFYKFNSFHWHLTDDQGWRIEIKEYPKLTEVGAWRDSTRVGHFRDIPARFDGTPYGGFYTREEVKDIIKYASVRGITIIPEIDIPGHSRAIIASYPELSTSPDTIFDVAANWGMYNRKNNVLAPNEKTFAFLKAVFGEIADLFPSTYIHVGGDECSKIWWNADTATQAFMKKHGLKNDTALQAYFIQQVIEDLKLKGKKVIGWDEILEGDVDTSAIIMNWRGVKAAIRAVKEKHEVIMAPGAYTYFNYSQTRNEDSLTAGGYLPLDKVYNFEPIPGGLNKEEAKYILGAQGNVWTEYMTNFAKVEYMIFPRMTAISEVLWTDPDKRDFIDFLRRLKENAIPRYQFWKSKYFKDSE